MRKKIKAKPPLKKTPIKKEQSSTSGRRQPHLEKYGIGTPMVIENPEAT
jgi:hypothetical protein